MPEPFEWRGIQRACSAEEAAKAALALARVAEVLRRGGAGGEAGSGWRTRRRLGRGEIRLVMSRLVFWVG